MNPAIQKTLTLVLLIVIGYCLKSKIKTADQRKGIKTLILSIALPAMIFVALLKIEIEPALIYLPIGILALNFLLFFIAKWTISWFGIAKDSKDARTWMMLMPSFAPGLCCFPFLIEYASDESLALAALTDVGNKVFVLIVLYLLAVRWHYQTQNLEKQSSAERIKSLLTSMIKEPVNAVILLAILMLAFGLNMASLPLFLQDGIGRMSLLMTPMVLLFIGIAVRIDWQQFRKIGMLLVFRSACAFLISALLLAVLPSSISAALLIVIVAFPQSAASFWPFAHISAVNDMETDKDKTFNTDFALNILALSLPFSTVVMLCICSMQSFFLNSLHLFLMGLVLLVVALLPKVLVALKARMGSRKVVVKVIRE
ncbi:MAG: AEC family transporter [Bacteroidota bacterium]